MAGGEEGEEEEGHPQRERRARPSRFGHEGEPPGTHRGVRAKPHVLVREVQVAVEQEGMRGGVVSHLVDAHDLDQRAASRPRPVGREQGSHEDEAHPEDDDREAGPQGWAWAP